MRTLTVTGHGTVRVEPDAAEIRVAAVQRSAGVAEAVAGVDASIREVGVVAREHSEPTELASTGLTVWPAHDRQGVQAGFEARHSLTILCAGLDAAGALVTALVTRLGDRLVIDGVSLVVRERRPHEDRAREAAYADARRRAEHLATLAGARLEWVVAASEGILSTRREALVEQSVVASMRDVSFEGGQQSVSTSVTLTFELA